MFIVIFKLRPRQNSVKMKVFLSVAVSCLTLSLANAQCAVPSVTTASGTHAPGEICSGQLIFEDNFDTLDQAKWRHENTLSGGGNWEFQWYVNDRSNSYVTGGNFHIRPTFTSDMFGESFLRLGRVVIPEDQCTDAEFYGCDRQGSFDNIINPIRSARVSSINSFGFKFGTVEIRAKMPAGNWLWPALWMMPKASVYGGWPQSGEIDITEIRGNRQLYNGNVNVGVEQAGSTMHFGPAWNVNGYETTHWTRNQQPGFDANFHTYKLVWTQSYLEFSIDGILTGRVDAGSGFWDRGGFAGSGLPNPWAGASNMAPFDQEFYLIMNNAVGGIAYFADHFENRDHPKPWLNTSPRAAADFWEDRARWESTWNLAHTDDAHLQVDYVRVWAL